MSFTKKQVLVLVSLTLMLMGCSPKENTVNKGNQTMPQYPHIPQVTPEDLALMRVDYSADEVNTMRDILLASSRVLAKQSTVEQERNVIGEGGYTVPKTDAQPINSWGNYKIYSMRGEGSHKGFSYGFMRNGTTSPWLEFELEIDRPYEFEVNVPAGKQFLDDLGLTLIKAVANHDCRNPRGQCNAFYFSSKKFPTLTYLFLTQPERSSLKSGIPTNFWNVVIKVAPSK